MTCWVENGEWFIHEYNTENRISSIIKLASGDCESLENYATKWEFMYDGDGVRTTTMTTMYEDGVPTSTSWTAYYFGGAYEIRSDNTTIKYYNFGGQTIMNDGDGLKYLLTDHLGSVVAVTDDEGNLVSQQRYLPFGGVRSDINDITQTDYGYTGQRNLDSNIGLMDYKARFYSPVLNKFIQPDTIVPHPINPQAWNRYSYVGNRPINFLCDADGYCDQQSSINQRNSNGSCIGKCPSPKPPIPKDERDDGINPNNNNHPTITSRNTSMCLGGDWTCQYWEEMTYPFEIIDKLPVLSDFVESAINIGRPGWKYLKGGISLTPWGEAFISASLQFAHDAQIPSLSNEQRSWRAGTAAVQAFAADVISEGVGWFVGAPIGASIQTGTLIISTGGFGAPLAPLSAIHGAYNGKKVASFITNAAIEYFVYDKWLTPAWYEAKNLGIP
jgi:RHS repeat-associated protein